MKKLFLALGILFLFTTNGWTAQVDSMPKGGIQDVFSAITGTTTSSAIDISNYSLLAMEIDLSATGTPNWTFHILGSLDENGTYVVWKEGTTALSTGALTADSGNTFKGLPDWIKVVGTENSGTGTATVRVQGFN